MQADNQLNDWILKTQNSCLTDRVIALNVDRKSLQS